MFHRGTSYLSVGQRDDDDSAAPSSSPSSNGSFLRGIGCLILISCFLFLITPAPNNNHHNGAKVPEQLSPHRRIVDPRERTRKLPVRVQSLLAQSQIVGDHLQEVKDGSKTVEEAIHQNVNKQGSGIGSSAHIGAGALSRNAKSAPMTLNEILAFLNSFVKKLTASNVKNKHATFHGIWSAYHDLVAKHLYPWDQEYLRRMPPRRQDGSIYLSVVSFRDEFCVETLKDAFNKAKNPDNLFIGLVQQNCEDEKCRRGSNVGPDPDCYHLFCSSSMGKKFCNNGQIRLLRMKEAESLGPYMARYFASKLWMGEQWYMQIDSHMSFLQNWDALSIQMLEKAPSEKPVISNLPPPNTSNLQEKIAVAAPRLCGAVFATSDIEGQIVRLERSYNYDRIKLDTPRFAPFVAAGYLIAHSDMLRDVPFDPFLPYLFLGEEILLSARLWTSGYDIFSPTISLVGHRYERNQQPKFWEAIHMAFTNGVHNPLQMLVLNRIKQQLGYPESARDMIKPKTLLTAVEQYSMGHSRSLDEYLKIVGLNVSLKEVTYTAWCETGQPPPGFEKHNHLYNS
mmetsp:Transcript_29140/g.58536  ORF Transcript_29140/g.58536 Transcript_29140/m.58536 type:complete len:565 (+) Transcript_29140:54-1748(+)